MFTRRDLSTLMSADPPIGVSIFMPTHIRGPEIRQDPIRLKNLAAEARDLLMAAGMERAAAEAFVEPAATLVDDHAFWQHQEQGLALFLDGGPPRWFKVPIALDEHVIVGAGFHVRPLLPMLAVDGAFVVLTITTDEVALFDASRYALASLDAVDLPFGIDDVPGESDYENVSHASPSSRPHTGSIGVASAQVYGDTPAERNKDRLVNYVRRVAAALEQRLAGTEVPVVLAADAEIGGHFKKFTTMGPRLAGVIDVNPASLDSIQLHAAAYAIMQPRLNQTRNDAVERFEALHASHDVRAVIALEDVVRAAHQGRVETLLITEAQKAWGRYDEAADAVLSDDAYAATGDDHLETAAVRTLQQGGTVHVLTAEEMPENALATAILRY